MENALTLKEVNVKVSKKFELRNINLEVPKGTICGLVGKNGAGKTTLIHTIMNMMERDSGEILYNGLKFFEAEVEVKTMINCVFDDFYINKDFKVNKVMKCLGRVYENFDYDFCEKYFKLFDIQPDSKISKCSLGVQKKINIILTMACKPKILLLDEPTSSLDPSSRVTVLEMLMEYMQDEENTVLFSTHITSDLDRIADYVAMLDNGSIVFCKEKNELLEGYTAKLGMMPTIEDICVYIEKERG